MLGTSSPIPSLLQHSQGLPLFHPRCVGQACHPGPCGKVSGSSACIHLPRAQALWPDVRHLFLPYFSPAPPPFILFPTLGDLGISCLCSQQWQNPTRPLTLHSDYMPGSLCGGFWNTMFASSVEILPTLWLLDTSIFNMFLGVSNVYIAWPVVRCFYQDSLYCSHIKDQVYSSWKCTGGVFCPANSLIFICEAGTPSFGGVYGPL